MEIESVNPMSGYPVFFLLIWNSKGDCKMRLNNSTVGQPGVIIIRFLLYSNEFGEKPQNLTFYYTLVIYREIKCFYIIHLNQNV